jgi:hypothetical protein
MLAGDPIEASQQAQAFLADASLEDYYDSIMLDGLRLAEADARLRRLDRERMKRVLATFHEVVDDLEAHEDRAVVEAEEVEASPLARLETEFELPASVPERCRNRARCCAFPVPASSTKPLPSSSRRS